MYETKNEDVYKDFNKDKEMFDFSNYSTKSEYYDNSNKLVVGKMQDETVGVEEFVALKPIMYLYLVDDNNEHNNAKGIKKNVVATIGHNEYKNTLLNEKCLRQSMGRIQSKFISIFLPCFDDKIYIQNNGCNGLALGY